MYLLGTAHLDPEKQLLTVGTRTVALQRKPYLVLLYMIENRHRMIYREELLDRFWEGKDVYDQSLSKAIGNIRKAFGESRTSSAFIETRWGLGYRYVGPFSESPSLSSDSSLDASSPPCEPANDLVSLSTDTLPTSDEGRTPAAVPVFDEASSGALLSRAPDSPPVKAPARRSLTLLFTSVIVIVAATTAALRLHNATQNKADAAAPMSIHSVAVLPFTADTNNEEDKYLGLGLADAVADRLGTVPQLTVRSSTTVRSILGLNPDPASADKKLRVQALVKGDLHRASENVVITVRLLDSGTGASLWSGTFHADNTNIFGTEDSIARQVSAALLPQLGMNALRPSYGPDTDNPQAYGKYMKAKFFATTRTQNSLAKAIDLLNEAILIDPKYAHAYAALADCYQLQGFYHFAPPSEAYPRGKNAALKALALDKSIAEAHVALLSVLGDYDWDWQGVEREFNATVAIDPNYAVAFQYYGFALLGMGRGEEALVAMNRAAELDPVSPSIRTSLAWAYFLLRQDEQAVDQCKRVLELYPDFVPAHQLLGIVYGQMRSDQRAFAELNQAETLERDSSITPLLLDYELARTGKRTEAATNLESTLTQAHGASVPDYYLAAAWTALGDKQKALSALDRAHHVRSNWIIYLQYDPRFDDLRSEPQFKDLLHEIAFHDSLPTRH